LILLYIKQTAELSNVSNDTIDKLYTAESINSIITTMASMKGTSSLLNRLLHRNHSVMKEIENRLDQLLAEDNRRLLDNIKQSLLFFTRDG
jgi:predicted thioredoxin/glutaredoxin